MANARGIHPETYEKWEHFLLFDNFQNKTLIHDFASYRYLHFTSSLAEGQWYINKSAAIMLMARPVIVIRFGATHIGTKVTT